MAALDQVLEKHAVIGVDTAPFIYLWENHPRYFALAATLFRHLRRPQVQGVTSVITLIEASIHPQREGRVDLVRTYEQALLHSQQIDLLPIDVTLSRQAVALRAHYGIHVPDALQLAAAISSGATLFVTNDRRLASIQETQVVVLEDYVASEAAG